MDFIKFLLSIFENDSSFEKIKPIFEVLEKNNFDIKKVLSSLTPDMIAPIVKEFLNKKKSSQTENSFYGLTPVSNIADKEIIYKLNKYLGKN